MKKEYKSTADIVVRREEMAAASERVPLKYRTAAKVTAFILTIVMLGLIAASIFGAYMMFEMGVYTKPKEDTLKEMYSSAADILAVETMYHLANHNEEKALSYCQSRNLGGIQIDAQGINSFRWSYGSIEKGQDHFIHNLTMYWDTYGYVSFENNNGHYDPISITIDIPHELTKYDTLFFDNIIVNVLYALRYWVYFIGLAAVAVGIFCFVSLMKGAGHRPYYDEVQPGWGTWIPFDLLAAGSFLAFFLLLQFAVEFSYASTFMTLVLVGITAIAIAVMAIGLCMSLAVRVKLGQWWKNTIIYHVAVILWKILKKLGKGFRKIGALLMKAPLVWKTAVAFIGISLLEFFAIMVTYWEMDNYMIFWMLEKIVLFPAIIYTALMLKKLQKAGRAIAAGDLSYHVDTEHMLPDFKAHGENLNQIGEGMTLAVEHRLKSERMKTELITNVSHDIKTPLTSIINYSDLIEKEPCDNPKITEYAEVLHRQSERLKRLIEDLVEASKASTGNLEVLLAPCEVGVMMTQAIGEYEQRLENSNLTLMTSQPEEPIKIMADGRRLWRVFDNLMNNICKYGQPGTRVYFTLEATANEAVIAFKNTSRDPLNLSSEELMERFVRGDSSRNSDGNGLGLSIAKSLTELQKGTMKLTVDGDLFKVVLRFPRIR